MSPFTGEFGALRHDLTRVATFEDRPVGAILVVGKSIWDPQLHGPFIIDLFVHPDVRGMGVGRALLDDAVHACARAEDATLSLRVGEGTSPAALALYTRAGFQQR
ncbi:GNAT family N-acetyltransferase [Propioniciclava sinopodophylli]|nr:GNAT family N-acetyltransferase [Propioniciclava sinopodophylli]